MTRRRAAAAVAGVLLLALVAAALVVGTVRIRSAPPPLQVSLRAGVRLVPAPGTPPPVAVPPQGSLRLEADADAGGVLASQADAAVRPIGSVAKAMTALLVVEAHPLQPGDTGPTLVMTQADVDLYHATIAQGGSAVGVVAGERLSELDVLRALLLPSANNLAESLARWVAGSRDAFVARLNARAAALGMASTHFDDPSGFSPATVSTAADLVRLGRAVLASPALAAVVATTEAQLPDGTVLRNLDSLLRTEPGWLGIKTGSTDQAGGCLLFAVRRPVGDGGPPVTLVGAVLGQPQLGDALQAAARSVDTAFSGYALVRTANLEPLDGGDVTTTWGAGSGVVLGPARGPALLAVRRGSTWAVRVEPVAARAPLRAGDAVGTIRVVSGADLSWPVRASQEVAAPAWWWSLLHG